MHTSTLKTILATILYFSIVALVIWQLAGPAEMLVNDMGKTTLYLLALALAFTSPIFAWFMLYDTYKQKRSDKLLFWVIAIALTVLSAPILCNFAVTVIELGFVPEVYNFWVPDRLYNPSGALEMIYLVCLTIGVLCYLFTAAAIIVICVIVGGLFGIHFGWMKLLDMLIQNPEPPAC